MNIDAAGTTSSFTTGDALVATADNNTHQMTITRNGNVEQIFPMSMGKPGHDTADGTYYVQDKFSDIVMDSETYGFRTTRQRATACTSSLRVQIDNSGNFVHSAPWSVADQGNRNVSHGCINISPADAQVVLRQLRHRRSHRRHELRWQLYAKRRRPGLADVVKLCARLARLEAEDLHSG